MLDLKTLCQIEIPVKDPLASLAFYEQVFGWKKSKAEIHDYFIIEVPEDLPFGVSLIPKKNPHQGGPVLYFRVENAEKLANLAQACGGKKRFGPKRFPGYGMVWQIEDPDGNGFGLLEPS